MSRSNLPSFFFFQSQLIQGQEVEIVGDEASHILRSRRISEGETITLTDGNGNLATVRVISTVPKRNRLTAMVELTTNSEKGEIQRVLVSALPKGDRQSVMLDMATQLGMNVFIPLRCEYSSTKLQPKMKDKWRRTVRESSKQCRQSWFPDIRDELNLPDLLKDISDNTLLLYADHQGQVVGDLQLADFQRLRKIILVVGPEGGFSDQEMLSLRQSSGISIKLGGLILRTESAAISLLSSLNQFFP
ncbi:MAG: RsmE family RNA methyltransferase [Gammaproteobacteria bacterium]|nr:RsmE family RNA methyltransferase [Gammaproteobacteria bacterium]